MRRVPTRVISEVLRDQTDMDNIVGVGVGVGVAIDALRYSLNSSNVLKGIVEFS